MTQSGAIDVWAQPSIVRADRLRIPEADPVFAKSGSPPPFSVEVTAEAMLDDMDRAGNARRVFGL